MFNLEELLDYRKKYYLQSSYSHINFAEHDILKERKKTKVFNKRTGNIFKICKACHGSGLLITTMGGWIYLDACHCCNLLGLISWTDEIIRKDYSGGK